jgi:hypothetical protein
LPIIKKNVKGTEYLYFTYYDQKSGKKKEVYCGLASKPESKKKALNLEITYLMEQKDNLDEKVNKAENELKQLK